MTHQIRSRDVAPNALRRMNPNALRPVKLCRPYYVFRNDLVFEDLLFVINVVNEFVQGVNALLETLFDPSASKWNEIDGERSSAINASITRCGVGFAGVGSTIAGGGGAADVAGLGPGCWVAG